MNQTDALSYAHQCYPVSLYSSISLLQFVKGLFLVECHEDSMKTIAFAAIALFCAAAGNFELVTLCSRPIFRPEANICFFLAVSANCIPGYEGGSCTPCAAGYFKGTSGTEACQACASGKYLDRQAGTACLDCPADTTSPKGSETPASCTCSQPGYVGQGFHLNCSSNSGGCVDVGVADVAERGDEDGEYQNAFEYYERGQDDFYPDSPTNYSFYYLGEYTYTYGATGNVNPVIAYNTGWQQAQCSGSQNGTDWQGSITMPVDQSQVALPNDFMCSWTISPEEWVSDPVFRLEFDEVDLEGGGYDHLYVGGCSTTECAKPVPLYALGGKASEPFYIAIEGYAALLITFYSDNGFNSKEFKLRYVAYEKGFCPTCIASEVIAASRPSQAVCADIDECSEGLDDCDANAACINTVGSFTCMCDSGYNGSGLMCSDVDECTQRGMHQHGGELHLCLQDGVQWERSDLHRHRRMQWRFG